MQQASGLEVLGVFHGDLSETSPKEKRVWKKERCPKNHLQNMLLLSKEIEAPTQHSYRLHAPRAPRHAVAGAGPDAGAACAMGPGGAGALGRTGVHGCTEVARDQHILRNEKKKKKKKKKGCLATTEMGCLSGCCFIWLLLLFLLVVMMTF